MNYVFLTEFIYTLLTKTLLLFRISLLKRFVYKRVNTPKIFMVQQFLSCLARIRSRQYLFISSRKSYLPFKSFTACLQEKSSHKKNHAYLIQNISYILLKKCSRLQHVSQNGDLQACKTSSFFFLLVNICRELSFINDYFQIPIFLIDENCSRKIF